MKSLKWIYKVIRAFLLTAVIVVGSLFVSVYLILSIPPVQNYIRERASRELSAFLGGEVEIGSLNISPFSEILCKDVVIKDPNGVECLEAAELGAGINFWKLVLDRKIVITFVDLLDFKINLFQEEKDGPLNIDFIIKALSPKDKNKPPTVFDLKIHNIVLRNGEAAFSRLWEKKSADPFKIDFNYLLVKNINADVTLPRIANDHFEIDLRRLAFEEVSGLRVRDLSGFFKITPHEIDIRNFNLTLPSNVFSLPDMTLHFNEFRDIGKNLLTKDYDIAFDDLRIVPSDFGFLYPDLRDYTSPIFLSVKASGNINDINIRKLDIQSEQLGLDLKIGAIVRNLRNVEELELLVDHGSVGLNENFGTVLFKFLEADDKVRNMVLGAGKVNAEFSGHYSASEQRGAAVIDLSSNYGAFKMEASGQIRNDLVDVVGSLVVPRWELGKLLASGQVGDIREADILFDLHNIGRNPMDIEGSVEAGVKEIGLLSRNFENISVKANKRGGRYELSMDIDDSNLLASLEGAAEIDNLQSYLSLNADIRKFDSYSALLTDRDKKYELSGLIDAEITGSSLKNLTGFVNLDNFTFARTGSKSIHLDQLRVKSDLDDNGLRLITLDSDIVKVRIEGDFDPVLVPAFALNQLRSVAPSLVSGVYEDVDCGSGSFSIDIEDAERIIEFFKLPVDPLTAVGMSGQFNSLDKTISFSTNIPYIVQNGNKLIRDTYLDIMINGVQGMGNLSAGTVYPTKKGDLKLDLDISALRDNYNILVDFNEGLDTSFKGELSLSGKLEKNLLSGGYEIDFNVDPTSFYLNGAEWKMGGSNITYSENTLSIRNFNIRHDNQFVIIEGVSDKDAQQMVEVKLAEIDLGYIFDTLNINYVTFGGKATGEVVATELFSQNPKIHTRFLDIENLSYNGAVLGNGKIRSSFDLPAKKVNIHADISNNERNVAVVDGGVWIGRDSLAFDFDTDKVDIRFLKPFMKAFTSDVNGHASGHATLYGTFKDIDLKGKIFADDISILVDYTNVRYSGSDTVYIDPGIIRIPDFKLRDKYGNEAVLNGVVRHTYFHQPEFDFDVTDINRLLVYDTNPKMNPVWYGTIFGSGNARIEGKPGYVNIFADMTTDRKTKFTFVLSDEQQAVRGSFLTFSDRRKEAVLAMVEEVVDTVPECLKRFQKVQQQEEEGESDVFSLDLRASVTPDAELILIMDPAAGDRITAYGDGAMNITYDSKSDDMRMFGKYILDHGTYNFSLQDIILKEFTIKPGSSISFTGSPYSGVLDITAAYRVNTNLTELDNSFSSDRDLNRTNVPVEALLKVTGPMTEPDIGFDIDLPTVTEETARKVKSIISTDDMMSRQVIYLVALNKFYSPEYMGVSSTGGEWASVASSTLSSQIQNMIGQLTDKFTLSPSLRSDKGDFSDLEFDVALSSRLFNNRLLINGNLGYRDPSTSNTTFVGDFDIEYLLNRKGNFRLKAYNHFNDQNYYLKSALTTQGLGVVWTKDFDNLNNLFNRRKKKEEPQDSLPIAPK